MKMRRNIYAIATFVATALLITACAGEEDDIFSGSAAERLAQGALDAAARLESSPAGWAMEYYPTDETEEPYGLGYLLLTKFNSDGSATVGMNNAFSDNAYLEDTSAWEVITDNGIVLTYNTYNKCIHAFSDPEDIEFTDTDETGYGCEGDYEFIVVDTQEEDAPEYIMLKGKKRGMYIRLSRLEEGTVFEDYINDVQTFNSTMFSSSAPNYLLLTVGDDKMEMDDMSTGIPNIYEFGTDAIANESYHPYLVTKHNGAYHLRFRDEFSSPNGYTTQELVYNEELDCFIDPDDETCTINGPVPIEFFLSEMEDGGTWQLRRTSEMSEVAGSIFEEVYSAFSAMKYTLQYVRLTLSDEYLLCTLSYRNNSGRSGSVSYKYAYQTSDNTVTLAYEGASDTTAETVLGTIPSIQNLLDVLKGTMTISASTTRFDLTNIKLTSSDGDTWFVFTLL